MGAPATVLIPAEGEKTLRYGTLFSPYIGNILNDGILSLDYGDRTVIANVKGNSFRFKADPEFTALKKIEKIGNYSVVGGG
jgi:hypothetical protein